MPDPVIAVEGISKKYVISHRADGGLRHALEKALRSPFRWRRRTAAAPSREDFWALKDLSFELRRGEVLGVIGRNGAGKSTLLKILSRITEPTSGRIVIDGRVASLLEVGTGFHPELTGRENIFLNGAILGMSRVEIRRKFDEIVAFSEVERFIDTPVKRYSSGMYVRLAFAVAAHLEPEILIIDEVLAVGDAAFQKKCLGKMGDAAAREGRTVLFVSHNMGALRSLCPRAVLLEGGRLVRDGAVEDVVREYLEKDSSMEGWVEWNGEKAPKAGGLALERAYLLGARGEASANFAHHDTFTLCVDYRVDRPLSGLLIGFLIQNGEGVEICGSNDWNTMPDDPRTPGRYTSRCDFPGHLLNEGTYHVRIGTQDDGGQATFQTPFCLTFSIEDVERHGFVRHRLPGVVRPRLKWRIDRQ